MRRLFSIQRSLLLTWPPRSMTRSRPSPSRRPTNNGFRIMDGRSSTLAPMMGYISNFCWIPSWMGCTGSSCSPCSAINDAFGTCGLLAIIVMGKQWYEKEHTQNRARSLLRPLMGSSGPGLAQPAPLDPTRTPPAQATRHADPPGQVIPYRCNPSDIVSASKIQRKL